MANPEPVQFNYKPEGLMLRKPGDKLTVDELAEALYEGTPHLRNLAETLARQHGKADALSFYTFMGPSVQGFWKRIAQQLIDHAKEWQPNEGSGCVLSEREMKRLQALNAGEEPDAPDEVESVKKFYQDKLGVARAENAVLRKYLFELQWQGVDYTDDGEMQSHGTTPPTDFKRHEAQRLMECADARFKGALERQKARLGRLEAALRAIATSDNVIRGRLSGYDLNDVRSDAMSAVRMIAREALEATDGE